MTNIQQQANSKSSPLTLLVVTEDGGDVTATDHSSFSTSKIKVSVCPGSRGKKREKEKSVHDKKKNIYTLCSSGVRIIT